MNYQINYFLLVLLLLSAAGCKEEPPVTPPPPEPPKAVVLSLVDVGCTEAFIKVTATDSVLPLSISLSKDESTFANFMLTKTDTIVINTTLQSNKIYTYQTTELINGKEEKSDTLQVKTLDITSDNFTWNTFTFRDPTYGSSALNDVAIIDENNIVAVGEIYNDTTGIRYNAVQWDGNNWTIKRIPYYYQGQPFYPIQTIFAFSPNDIWFGGNGIIHWDGNQYNPIPIPTIVWGPHQINKIWGTSANNLYIVGNDGKIAHYQNGYWSKVESGTTTNVNDIWGTDDSSTNNFTILCTVSSRYQLGDYKLLSISGNTAKEYITWPYTRLYGVWFNSPQKIYIVGSGAYLYRNNSLNTINLSTNYFLTRVKGNALNDIYITASDAQVFHYNGINWNEVFNGIDGGYEGMDVKGNTVVLVGYNIEGGMVGKAVVTVGKRMN
jgi:hypothetical protein